MPSTYQTFRAMIGQADWVVNNYALGDVGVLRRKPGRQHAAHRMADDHRLRNIEMLQDAARVQRHVVEDVRNVRLRRSSEPDMIWKYYTEAFTSRLVKRSN